MEPIEKRYGSRAISPTEWTLPGLKFRWILDHAPRNGSVLEIGSGDGKLLRSIKRLNRGLQLFGTDVVEPTTVPEGYEFTLSLGDFLPFEAERFDVVLVFDVLEHVADPAAFLREVRRVVKPCGSLLAFVPIEGEFLSFYTLFRSIFGNDTYVITKDHHQAFTHASLDILLRVSFSIEKKGYAYHFLGQLMDASFCVALKFRKLQDMFYNENELYRESNEKKSIPSRIFKAALAAANLCACVESTILKNRSFTSAGALIVARPSSSQP